MSENAKKEIQEIIRRLKGHGIEVEQLPNGHYRTKTRPAVTMSFSPSDTNAAHAARREIRRVLGIDLRAPRKKKGSTADFAMKRLHERALVQMERGATVADLARLSVYENEMKQIGGWTSLAAAEVGISGMLKKGSRLMKQNHDALAAALNKLEHSDDKAFQRHLDKAAEHFGKTRLAPKVEPPPKPVEPEPEPEVEEPEAEEVEELNIVALSEEEHRALANEIRDLRQILDTRSALGRVPALNVLEAIRSERPELLDLPAKITVDVKIGLDAQTLALLAKLLPS